MQKPKFSPMLAVSGTPFDNPDFLFEIKWDGIRAIAEVNASGTTLWSRNSLNITQRYPELRFESLVQKLPVILDGEIVVLEDGLPNFHTLQTRDRLQDPRRIAAAARSIPAIYMAFDILYLGEADLTALPLRRRKEYLSSVIKQPGPNLLLSQFIRGEGKNMFALAQAKGLEGVMAKQLDSPYQMGKRSNYWVKFRNVKSMSCVICGYVLGNGGRRDLGSLILGVYSHARLVYIGNVGSGLDQREISFLLGEFRAMARDASPFPEPPPLKNAVWVEPRLVCEVKYLEKREVLRHPTFVGLRQDLKPSDCRFEQGDSK